ncbi:MAG TPA: hypothetical protein DCZ30_00650 [Clostridiales bacterium]|nr:hypothetical protein [Clostridiales bacterium]
MTFIITSVLFICIQFIFNNHYEFKQNINLQNQSIFILNKNLNPKEIANQLSKNKNSKNKNQNINNKKQNPKNIK